jgi:hypothetical protein
MTTDVRGWRRALNWAANVVAVGVPVAIFGLVDIKYQSDGLRWHTVGLYPVMSFHRDVRSGHKRLLDDYEDRLTKEVEQKVVAYDTELKQQGQ